jgi:hypothetical protein
MDRFEVAHKVFANNPTASKQTLVTLLQSVGFSRSVAYSLAQKKENGLELCDKRTHNGARPIIVGKQLSLLAKEFNNQTGKSLRRAALKYGTSHSTIANTLKRVGITCYKRKKAPKYKGNQPATILSAMSRLYRFHLTDGNGQPPFIIMDDETYITENDHFKYSNRTFYAHDPNDTVDSIRYAGVKKFPMKVGIWYAISDCGMSDAYVWQQGLAIDGDRYKKQCIMKRLLPFINKHGLQNNHIFWPDKASAHYSKAVLQYLGYKQINVVPKQNNPTNVPQCRPIENFHAIIKRRVFEDGFMPKTAAELEVRVRQILAQGASLSPNFFTDLSVRIRVLVDRARRNGIYSVHQ